MKILAVDVGVGTQDIMLYDSDYPIENSIKMVMPSPTKIIAERIKKHHNDILIKGNVMGGGPVSRAIKGHLKRGYKVLMTERSARTIRDDLDSVKALGIKIVPDKEQHPEMGNIQLQDVDLNAIKDAISKFDVEFDFDHLGIAVQDHGFMKGMGDRNFRFMKIKEKLNIPKLPDDFAYHDGIPEYFTRMNGIFNSLKNYYPTLMDSKFASLTGATCDEYVKSLDNYVIIDVGNGHTLAATIENGRIMGVFEHHTSSMTPDKMQSMIEKLINGTLTNEEVHQDGGHGAWIIRSIDDIECVVAAGPIRRILQKTTFKLHFAAPAGDVMMTGPVGLIKTIMGRYKY